MAVEELNCERSLYKNATRDKWQARIAGIESMAACTVELRNFRREHAGPNRESYALYNDALWIENEMEQKLAQLKCEECTDAQMLEMCTTGESVSDVVARWGSQLDVAKTRGEVEELAAYYRCMFKPPIMPSNDWMRSERQQTTRLMELRTRREQHNLPLDELRRQRGATLVANSATETHQMTVEFEGGESIKFSCRESEDVISAALRDQVILMSQCREGRCGSCKAVGESGDYEFGEGVNVYSLPEEEQEQGQILCCQTFPRSDMVIKMPYERRMVSFGTGATNGTLVARVTSIEEVGDDVQHLVLEHLHPVTHQPLELSYTPGQYVNLGEPGDGAFRSFSMATPSDASGTLDFLVRHRPGGVFSEGYLARCEVGQELRIEGPHGMFRLTKSGASRRLFIASGTGIAPILAMLKQMRDEGDTTPSSLYFSVRSAHSQLCSSELTRLQGEMPNLAVERFLAPKNAEQSAGINPIVMGVGQMLRREDIDTETLDVYVCGSARLVGEVEEVCKRAHIGERRIHSEAFIATDVPQTDDIMA